MARSIVVAIMMSVVADSARADEGAAFVRAVVDQVGMAGFNEVWANSTNLPTLPEIAEPSLWVKRVHG